MHRQHDRIAGDGLEVLEKLEHAGAGSDRNLNIARV